VEGRSELGGKVPVACVEVDGDRASDEAGGVVVEAAPSDGDSTVGKRLQLLSQITARHTVATFTRRFTKSC